MQGIIFERIGDPQDVLSCTDILGPSNSQDQVLVRVRARPVQPADLAFIRGQYRIRPIFPQTAGLEGCGEVVRGGEPTYAPGDRVAFRMPGTWAELASVESSRLISVPDEITDEIASQISLNPVSGPGGRQTAALLSSVAGSIANTIPC